MNDVLMHEVMVEYRRLSAELKTERSVTTDSARLQAAAVLVATRALQTLCDEILHGGGVYAIGSPCLRER